MQKILSMKDRIKVKVDEVTFTCRPLRLSEKEEILGQRKMESGQEVVDLNKQAWLYIKYGVVDVHGVKLIDGSDYKVEFDGECLSDDSVEEIYQLSERSKLLSTAYSIMIGDYSERPKYIGTESEIEGVQLEILSNPRPDT